MDSEIYSEEVVLANWEYRTQKWESILNRQFQLVYYGKMTYDVIDNLAVSEFEALYGILVTTKQEEKETFDRSVMEAKSRSKQK